VHVADAGDAAGQVERQEERAGGVDVHVPQAGDEVLPAAVHDPGPLRHPDVAGLADGCDPVAGDDDRHPWPGRRPSSVDDGDAGDGQRPGGRVLGAGRERPGQGGDGQASDQVSHGTLRLVITS